MLELRFDTARLKEQSCDPRLATARWGEQVAQRLSLRLQQLAAMVSPRDLEFLPCDTTRDGDGRFAVEVHDGVVLVLRATTERRKDVDMVHVLTVVDVRERTS